EAIRKANVAYPLCTFVAFVVAAFEVPKPQRTQRYTKETNLPEKPPNPDERLQAEFNRWANQGEGEKMEANHPDITEKAIRLMDLRPGERVLDLGCGSGWATRLLARIVG